jgi:hypothetical protein
MIEPKLSEKTFLQLSMHYYDNPQCTTIEEFEDDLKRFMYLRKLFARYANNGELKERLIINHLIVLYNVFGIIATDFLFYKIDKEYWNILVTFLVYLDKMPEVLPEFHVKLSDIEIDQNIHKILRNL